MDVVLFLGGCAVFFWLIIKFGGNGGGGDWLGNNDHMGDM